MGREKVPGILDQIFPGGWRARITPLHLTMLSPQFLTHQAFDTIYFFMNLCEKSGVAINESGKFCFLRMTMFLQE
jgi:hypothetical protein